MLFTPLLTSRTCVQSLNCVVWFRAGWFGSFVARLRALASRYLLRRVRDTVASATEEAQAAAGPRTGESPVARCAPGLVLFHSWLADASRTRGASSWWPCWQWPRINVVAQRAQCQDEETATSAVYARCITSDARCADVARGCRWMCPLCQEMGEELSNAFPNACECVLECVGLGGRCCWSGEKCAPDEAAHSAANSSEDRPDMSGALHLHLRYVNCDTHNCVQLCLCPANCHNCMHLRLIACGSLRWFGPP